jgi:deoxyribodipyrimidine photo-lyase
LQTEKFDKDLKYIRKWIPELDSLAYPKPIVVHEFARDRVLAAYSKALKEV